MKLKFREFSALRKQKYKKQPEQGPEQLQQQHEEEPER